MPRELLERRLWNNLGEFLEYMARNGVVIVVGSHWPLPLITDKWLADITAVRLAEKGFGPIVLTDEILYRPLHMVRHPEGALAGDTSLLLDRLYKVLTSSDASKMLAKLVERNLIAIGAVSVIKSINEDDVKLVILAKNAEPSAKLAAVNEICKRESIPVKYVEDSHEFGRVLGLNKPVEAVALKGSIERLAEAIGEKTILDLLVKYRAPIIAIGSCYANDLMCNVAREGAPRRDPYGNENVVGVSQWRGTEAFIVYGLEPEETRDLLLKSVPQMLRWLEEKYNYRRVELVKYVDIEKLFAPVHGGLWAPDDAERDFEEYRIGGGPIDTRLLVAERAVLIVVPTWVESELWERRWAYKLVWELRKHGIWGVVVTDKYLLEEGQDAHGRVLLEFAREKKTSIISIGGPVSNSLTRMIEEEVLRSKEKYGDLWIARGNIAIAEWEGIPVTVVWGATLQDTVKRLQVFIDKHLKRFIERVKVSKVVGEKGSQESLGSLLGELLSDPY